MSDFLVVLLLSPLMLIPHVPTIQIGAMLALLGATAILRAARTLLTVRRTEAERAPRWLLLQRFALPLLGNLFILGAGRLLLEPSQNVSNIASLLVSAPILLIISGCRTAWLLVLHAAD